MRLCTRGWLGVACICVRAPSPVWGRHAPLRTVRAQLDEDLGAFELKTRQLTKLAALVQQRSLEAARLQDDAMKLEVCPPPPAPVVHHSPPVRRADPDTTARSSSRPNRSPPAALVPRRRSPRARHLVCVQRRSAEAIAECERERQALGAQRARLDEEDRLMEGKRSAFAHERHEMAKQRAAWEHERQQFSAAAELHQRARLQLVDAPPAKPARTQHARAATGAAFDRAGGGGGGGAVVAVGQRVRRELDTAEAERVRNRSVLERQMQFLVTLASGDGFGETGAHEAHEYRAGGGAGAYEYRAGGGGAGAGTTTTISIMPISDGDYSGRPGRPAGARYGAPYDADEPSEYHVEEAAGLRSTGRHDTSEAMFFTSSDEESVSAGRSRETPSDTTLATLAAASESGLELGALGRSPSMSPCAAHKHANARAHT